MKKKRRCVKCNKPIGWKSAQYGQRYICRTCNLTYTFDKYGRVVTWDMWHRQNKKPNSLVESMIKFLESL